MRMDMTYIREKLWGKRPVEDEPSSKRRKAARSSHCEEGPISIGVSAQPRRWQMVLPDSSDDDETATLPPPSTETPTPAMPAGVETRERWRAHEAAAAVPESARAVPVATARAATAVPGLPGRLGSGNWGRQASPRAYAGDPGGGNRGHQPKECGDTSQLGCWARWLRTAWRESQL